MIIATNRHQPGLVLRMNTVLETATGLGAFDAPRADLDRAVREPVIARLSDLGCIRATGADAVAFLQSQLTNDVSGLGTGGAAAHRLLHAEGAAAGHLPAVA